MTEKTQTQVVCTDGTVLTAQDVGPEGIEALAAVLGKHEEAEAPPELPDGATVTKVWRGKQHEVKLGPWTRKYCASTLEDWVIDRDTLGEAIAAVRPAKAKTRQIVSIGTYETRAVEVGHSRVHFQWYRPTVADEDADLTRNLMVLA